MFQSIDEFIAEWENESKGTVRVLSALSDESLKTKVYPEGRTLGFIAWHIANTLGEMMSHVKLDVKIADGHENEPESVEQILNEYKRQSNELVKSIKEKWTDESLVQDMPIYGEVWKGSSILSILIKHEIHHRAQMTVLMRQAGLSVPGIYGPSKEEWAALGAPAMK